MRDQEYIFLGDVFDDITLDDFVPMIADYLELATMGESTKNSDN